MPSLSELERVMTRVLRRELPVGAGAEVLGCDPARLAIYRRFVRSHIVKVLAADFGIVRALLPAERWDALCDGYFHAHPAESWELNAACAAFPELVATRLDAGDEGLEPFHVSLAQYEWERLSCYLSAERVPTGAEVEGPVLNPTLAVLQLACPVVPWLMRWYREGERPEGPLPVPGDGPELVLVFRDAEDDKISYYTGSDDLLFALKVVHEGLDPEATARSAGLPVDAALAAMDRAAEIGLVIRPSS